MLDAIYVIFRVALEFFSNPREKLLPWVTHKTRIIIANLLCNCFSAMIFKDVNGYSHWAPFRSVLSSTYHYRPIILGKMCNYCLQCDIFFYDRCFGNIIAPFPCWAPFLILHSDFKCFKNFPEKHSFPCSELLRQMWNILPPAEEIFAMEIIFSIASRWAPFPTIGKNSAFLVVNYWLE